MEKALPAIPAKRYFTIGEVSELCGVKPYVLRYWEQEFTQLKPMKRRGNRRYYQHHEVLLIRRIRELLYDRASRSAVRATGWPSRCLRRGSGRNAASGAMPDSKCSNEDIVKATGLRVQAQNDESPVPEVTEFDLAAMRAELLSIRSCSQPEAARRLLSHAYNPRFVGV